MKQSKAVKSHKRTLTGTVVSNKMTNTIVVKVITKKRHPLYGKVVTSSKKYKAETKGKAYEVGAKVAIVEARSFSKDKKWLVS
jgi:small subunit ribosomal protein S17